MADNIAITAGAGTTVATEDEGGVHYQKVKLVASGSGTTAALSFAEDAAHTTGDHGIMALAVRSDTATAVGANGDYHPILLDSAGRVHVNVGTGAVTSTYATLASVYHAVAAATDNAANVKASAGTLHSVHVFNVADYPVYVKFHNTAGVPTAGSGVVLTVGVQAGTHRDVLIPQGRAFATGIGISIVKGITDASTTATAASDCVVDVIYA